MKNNPAYDSIKNNIKYSDFYGLSVDMCLENINRSEFVRHYCYTIPTPSLLEKIAQYGPILEVASGGGYFAYMLKQMGVDIIATDKLALADNHYQNFEWHATEQIEAIVALKKYPDRTILLSWPCYMSIWAYNLIKKVQNQTVIYIGEEKYGCCAENKFFNYLDKHFEIVEEIPTVIWRGLHDKCFVYRRKNGSFSKKRI